LLVVAAAGASAVDDMDAELAAQHAFAAELEAELIAHTLWSEPAS
jgi:hypothetical protein